MCLWTKNYCSYPKQAYQRKVWHECSVLIPPVIKRQVNVYMSFIVLSACFVDGETIVFEKLTKIGQSTFICWHRMFRHLTTMVKCTQYCTAACNDVARTPTLSSDIEHTCNIGIQLCLQWSFCDTICDTPKPDCIGCIFTITDSIFEWSRTACVMIFYPCQQHMLFQCNRII